MRLLATRLTAIASAVKRLFSPASLFRNSEQGVWYDPSDLSTLFQDSAGTTPVTAVEQPVGLMLDKSKGLVLGAELETNGDFSDGTTGWGSVDGFGSLTGEGISVSDGVMTCTGTSGLKLSSTVTFVVGKTYKISADIISTNASVYLTVAQYEDLTSSLSQGAPSASAGSRTIVWKATLTSAHVGIRCNTAGTYSVDNISVKELPGNHATQATSTKRPVLSAKVNLLTGSAALATQSVTTAAIPYTLKHTGTGTITLSGTSTAGPLVGPGTLTFTPTAGTLTLTVTGSVTEAQLETGAVATRYQWANTVADYDTVGFNKYLKFDGVDDSMSTATVDFTATDKMTVLAGLLTTTISGTGYAFVLGDYTASGGLVLHTNYNTNNISVLCKLTAISCYGFTRSPIQKLVLAAKVDLAGVSATDEIILRRDGINKVLSPQGGFSGPAGTGNFGNYVLFIGSRKTGAELFSGNIYSLIIRGAQSTDSQIVNAENYVNSKTGAF